MSVVHAGVCITLFSVKVFSFLHVLLPRSQTFFYFLVSLSNSFPSFLNALLFSLIYGPVLDQLLAASHKTHNLFPFL